MKNTLIISTYFNNSHFIELQQKTFQKFIQDDFDFAVIDDAADHTQSLLSNTSARLDTINECRRLNIRYIEVPQSVHNFVDLGGLVRRDDPHINLNHPTERHQAVLRFLLNNYKKLGFDQYKTLIMTDADMFFKKPINISEYMEDYDMLGSWREQATFVPEENHSDEIVALGGRHIKFFTLCLLFINMEKLKDCLGELDNRSYIRVTDTGGRTHRFIEKHPEFKFGFLKDFNSSDYRVDFFSKTTTIQDDAEIIHYRAGSNWSIENMIYYKAKLNNMLKRFLPDFVDNNSISVDATSANKEHTIKADGTIISKYGL